MKIPIAPAKLLACAMAAARRAGTHALENQGRRRQVFKRFQHDVKLRLDLECQALAEKAVLARFPDHCILGEEGSGSAGLDLNEGYVWIIDPIDGTVNFFHGLRYWCCSVAVLYRGKAMAGAVYAPALDELYTGSTMGPALLNGQRICVSRENDLARSLIMTGTDKSASRVRAPLSILKRIALRVQKVRVAGSAALDICQVACGRADGYFETGIYLWDVAAAGLIVERAGGEASQLVRPDNRHRLAFMASNCRIHAQLKAAIGPCRQERHGEM